MKINKTHVRSFWDKFWKDKDGHIVIIQSPNIWIIVWFIFETISLLSSSKTVGNIGHVLAIVALGIWALFELFKGVNYFRRLLGLVFTLITILSIFGRGI